MDIAQGTPVSNERIEDMSEAMTTEASNGRTAKKAYEEGRTNSMNTGNTPAEEDTTKIPSFTSPFAMLNRSEGDKKVVGLKDYGISPSTREVRKSEWITSGESTTQRHDPTRPAKVDSPAPIQLSNPTKPSADAPSTTVPKAVKPIALPESLKSRKSVEELEFVARQKAVMNPFQLLVLGNLAALKVMGFYLVTLETFITCALTAGLTVFWFLKYQDDPDWSGGSMDFVLLAFAVTTPISAAIGMAFTRRDRALIAVADFRSFSYHLFCAHCMWDWPTKDGDRMGREEAEALQGVDWLEHCDAVLAQLIGIGDELSRFLTLPSASRSRHRMTRQGRKEAARTMEVAYYLLESMTTQRMTRLLFYSERLKKIGLPSGELSRIRQYERFLSDLLEQLKMIKLYRTPQALRSFARVFTILLPPFYSPTFAQVAIDTKSLGMGIGFGIITALGLTALFESLQVLEDPFTAFLALDGIDAREEFEVLHYSQLINTRKLVFPQAPSFPAGRRTALTRENRTGLKRRHKPGMPPKQTFHSGAAATVVGAATAVAGPPANAYTSAVPSADSVLTMEGTNHPVASPPPPAGDDTQATAPTIPQNIVIDAEQHAEQELEELGVVLPSTESPRHRGSVFEEDREEDDFDEQTTQPHHRPTRSLFSLEAMTGGATNGMRNRKTNAATQQQQQPQQPPTTASNGSVAAAAEGSRSVPTASSPYHRRTHTSLSAAGFLHPQSARRLPDF